MNDLKGLFYQNFSTNLELEEEEEEDDDDDDDDDDEELKR